MSVLAPGRGKGAASVSVEQSRVELAARIERRRDEIEQAVLTRVLAVADLPRTSSPEYVEGLRTSVAVVLELGIALVTHDEKRATPIPAALLTQARVAARNSVSLDTVLRRYFAGYTLLSDFLIEEAAGDDRLRGPALKDLLRAQASFFDRLLIAISEEHRRETSEQPGTPEERRAECVGRLLAGEFVDTSELAYELDAWHLGMLAAGPGAEEAIRELVQPLDGRLLTVCGDGETVSAWLGARRRLYPAEITCLASGWPPRISIAIGEPEKGLTGWRLTHRQAQAAFTVAMRSSSQFIRYADVVLLASAMQDDLLATSLRNLYSSPLDKESDGGQTSRKTLRAYFTAERNVSSAAALLGVSRRTVANRLRRIEDQLGHSLGSAWAQIEVALRLEDLASAPKGPADSVTDDFQAIATSKSGN